MTDLRSAAQQALAFTMRDFASMRDFEAAKAVLHDNLRAALAQRDEPKGGGRLPPFLQTEPVPQPGVWMHPWPPVRAQQAEPVDVGLLEYRGNSVAFIHQKMTAYRAGIDAAWDAFRARGLHPDGKTPLANMIAKYTAPPQRKPLTEEEVEQCFRDAGITIKGHRWTNAVRAIERAHGIVACDNIKE